MRSSSCPLEDALPRPSIEDAISANLTHSMPTPFFANSISAEENAQIAVSNALADLQETLGARTPDLVVSGINAEGSREILGLRIGDSESEAFWLETFRWLKERGLKGVAFVVSDDHNGLVNAARRCFRGAIWQRCQVHLMRNVLSYTGSRHKKSMAEGLKRVFSADSASEARQRFEQLAEAMQSKAAKAIECLENGLEDALAVMALPAKYRRRMKSTNMQERLIQEVRRRERVIRIFPNKEAALRLMGALLAEIHEEWQERRYLDMTEFNEWQQERKTKSRKTVAVIN